MEILPSVFIIESVRFKEERLDRREGNILRGILRLSGKDADYRYIRTQKELQAVLKQFAQDDGSVRLDNVFRIVTARA